MICAHILCVNGEEAIQLLQNLGSLHQLRSMRLAQLPPANNAFGIEQKLSWTADVVTIGCLFGDQQIIVANGLRAFI